MLGVAACMVIRSGTNVPERERRHWWIEILVLGGLLAVFFGVTQVIGQWRHPLRLSVDIDLSPWALPKYALFSLARGWIAYFFSLVFTLVVATWAYYDEGARRYIIPALDVLQSIPVLAFLAAFTLALVNLFPNSNTGLELACVFMMFTGQVWNMTFSYYDSLRGTPPDFRMLGKLYNFSWWLRFWKIELPFGTQGLVYNSMVSMAGGWFFLITTEASTLGTSDYRVPGIGSYMSVAQQQGNTKAMVYGIIAMGVVIIAVDRLVWAPLVIWSRKFKLDDFGTGTTDKSRFQLWMARSVAMQKIGVVFTKIKQLLIHPATPPSAATSLRDPATPPLKRSNVAKIIYSGLLVVIVALLLWGGFRLVSLLAQVHLADWGEILYDSLLTFIRVTAAMAIATLWTVPFGVWIGLNPRLSNRFQPVIQFASAFPAPMLYAWILTLVFLIGGNLQWGSVVLLLFGTQWYILFNVAASAAAIPNDIISCAAILRLKGWSRWKKFLIPAIMPGLVTGWITAAGGAWNASIVSEAVSIQGKNYYATGLGTYIAKVSENLDFPKLTAAVIVMSLIVVGINRTVWKKIQAIANDRCRFTN